MVLSLYYCSYYIVTGTVIFPRCALVGWWMASLHTACRETVPNSAQNARYVSEDNTFPIQCAIFFHLHVQTRVCSIKEATAPYYESLCCYLVTFTVIFLPFSPHGTTNTEANLPESQEFLSGIEDKKTTRFTDVSSTQTYKQNTFTKRLRVANLFILSLCLW